MTRSSEAAPIDQLRENAAVKAPALHKKKAAGKAAPDEPIRFDPKLPLPAGCPIQMLGLNGKSIAALDSKQQLVWEDDKFGKGTIIRLFGEKLGWAEHHFPKYVQVKGEDDKPLRDARGKLVYEKDGFNQAHVQEALIIEAARQPIFSAEDKVRGRGAHKGPDGELILHCGETLIVTPLPESAADGAPTWFERPVGFYGGFVFPARAEQPLPDTLAATVQETRALKALIATWRWKHGPIGAHLCLCWLGLAMIGGAVDFRPHIWVTGDSGTGKSTLQLLMREILHGLGLFISKGSAAGIRQSLEIDSVPVMFDEPEAGSTQQENITKVIEMARISSTGDRDVMGSQDHKAKEFILRSTFFFSSIIVSKMEPQDANRMAILELSPFPPDTEKLQIPMSMRPLGRRMRRRMMAQWPRWTATLLKYQAQLKLMGCTPREQDVYGTLLAAGDMLLEDDTPRSDSARVAEALASLAPLLTIAQNANERHFERCLGHLRTTRLSSAAGKHQENVSRWVHKGVVEILTAYLDSSMRNKLETHGLKIVTYRSSPDPKEPGKFKHGAKGSFAADFQNVNDASMDAGRACVAPDVYLAVAGATHRGVCEIFETSASYKAGGWVQALDALPGSIKETSLRVKFEGKSLHVVLIPIAEMIDLDEARLEAVSDEARRRAIEKEKCDAEAAKARPSDPKEAAKWDEYQAQMDAQATAAQYDADYGGLADFGD